MGQPSVVRSGGLVSQDQILDLEKRVGHELPDDYRSFLLSDNPREIRPCVVLIENFPRSPKVVIHQLYCFLSGQSCDINYALKIYADRVPAGYVPIASDPGGNLFVLSVTGDDRGMVYFWERAFEAEEGEPPTMDNMHKVASSFTELLEKLVDV